MIQKKKEIIVPLVPLRDVVIFPFTEVPLTFSRLKSNAALSSAFKSNKLVCFVCQKNSRVEIPMQEDFYTYGTLGIVEHMVENNGTTHCLVKGISRVKILGVTQSEPYFVVTVEENIEDMVENDESKALAKHVTDQVQKIFNLGKPIDVMILMRLLSGVSLQELANQVASVLDLKPADKQMLLEINSFKERLERVAERMSYEIKI